MQGDSSQGASLNAQLKRQEGQMWDELMVEYTLGLHYHLEVQANSKKMAQKTDAIFSIYGRNGIIP